LSIDINNVMNNSTGYMNKIDDHLKFVNYYNKNHIHGFMKALSTPLIKPMLPDLTALSKSFSQLSSPMDALSKSLSAIQVNSYFSEIASFSKAFSAFQMKPMLPGLTALSKSFSQLSSPMDALSKSLSAIQVNSYFSEIASFSKTFSAFQIKPIYPNISELLKGHEIFQIKPLFPQINNINNLIKKSSSLINTYDDIISSNLISVLDPINDDSLLNLNAEIDSSFVEVKKDKLSLQFYLTLLVSLLFAAYAEYSSMINKKEIVLEIRNSESKIINEIKIIEDKIYSGIYYIVIRKNNGYYCPSTKKSDIKFILYPNQKVRLIKEKGKWIFIEYFNNLTNYHEQAWCKKKYLKRL